jgi:alpha-ketoglutarate-dependent taurine dioxygenase
MTTIAFEPLQAIGAEVRGLDQDVLLKDEQLPAVVMDALERHGVLVFPDLHLDDETQVAFCRRLGEVVETTGTGTSGIQIISLDPERAASAAYLRGTFDWHVDGATQNIPPNRATILTAHEVADEGGDTEFASTYAAYDELSAEEQERFESIRVVHTVEATLIRSYPDATGEQRATWSELPRTVHPLIWTHRSGRKSLLLGATALSVEGMDLEEGQQFLQDLLDRATTESHVYHHSWSVGDTVIWDNCGVLHRALPYDETSPRDMHRTTLVGDELIT